MTYQILLFAFLLMQSQRRRKYLTCADIALLGHFDVGHCCAECHAEAAQHGNERALTHDTFFSKPGAIGQGALLCCHCDLRALHGYEEVDHYMEMPGAQRPYTAEELASFEDAIGDDDE